MQYIPFFTGWTHVINHPLLVIQLVSSLSLINRWYGIPFLDTNNITDIHSSQVLDFFVSIWTTIFTTIVVHFLTSTSLRSNYLHITLYLTAKYLRFINQRHQHNWNWSKLLGYKSNCIYSLGIVFFETEQLKKIEFVKLILNEY